MPTNPMVHFLIVFDHGAGHLLQAVPYTDAEAASREYARLEELHRGAEHLEIVLVGADSIETIHRTHGHYFDDAEARPYSRFLVDL